MENNKCFRGLLANNKKDANCVLYSVPFDSNASILTGAADAPKKLKQLSWWLPPYTIDGMPINNFKIFVEDNFVINDFNDINNNSDIFNDNKFKLIFGGDHSISIPFQRKFIEKARTLGKKPVIVHIDAHCDICDSYHGNNFSHACTVRRALENGLEEENLFMVGIREFEKEGYDYLIKNTCDIHLYTSLDIHTNGLNNFLKTIEKYNSENYVIYISFDIDVLDCSFAPGTGTPETLGLNPFHIRQILITLARFRNVVCLDVVEIAPPLDVNDVTSWTAIKLLYEFFGHLNMENK